MNDSRPGEQSLRHSWSQSDRFVPRAFVRPFQRFMDLETAGGVVLLASALAALVWANSPWGDAYRELWATHLQISVGELVHLDLSLVEWVNDGLMAVFFFIVGLEIKRELVQGELRDPRAAALPAIAAVGGMALPALIFLGFNAGSPSSEGWGVPMATDIAFAVGVVALVGDRIPSGAKIFLLTLAIADDIGAIVVIAVFYTDGVSVGWLASAAGMIALALLAKRLDVRSLTVYGVMGIGVWYSLHESGVHATLAGVALGLMTPVWSFYDPRRFPEAARMLVDRVERSLSDDVLTADELAVNNEAIVDLDRLANETLSPLERLEHRLSKWVAFGIVPVFALSNAGVEITADSLDGLLSNEAVLGIVLGLIVGKTVGVFGATFVAARLGVGRLPAGTSWRHVLGLSATAGIGFTVALFVAGLAFEQPELTADAKLGILIGSTIAGVLGYALLRTSRPATPAPVPDRVEPSLAD